MFSVPPRCRTIEAAIIVSATAALTMMPFRNGRGQSVLVCTLKKHGTVRDMQEKFVCVVMWCRENIERKLELDQSINLVLPPSSQTLFLFRDYASDNLVIKGDCVCQTQTLSSQN